LSKEVPIGMASLDLFLSNIKAGIRAQVLFAAGEKEKAGLVIAAVFDPGVRLIADAAEIVELCNQLKQARTMQDDS